ncbi:MAG: hypothetical protein HC779_08180 [Phyllobacteriaceae bacterium]|nr:hypothetical protein [Phyllobacteriaceae bacterium]
MLKPLAWAEEDGDHIYGVIKASAINHGGRTHGYTVPNPAAEAVLVEAALQQGNLRQIPLAGAAVAVIVNLPELGGKPIKLTGDILASIYLGEITQWNHSQITAANPGLPLPARAITPVWRSDGSGQSYVFSSYLARGNSKWRRTPGATNNLRQLAGRGVRGGAAVIEAVKATPGAIGYDSLGAAQKAQLPVAELRNASDKFIAPGAASINEALSQARWAADSLSADWMAAPAPIAIR